MNTSGRPKHGDYRCLYCRRHCVGISDLKAHEQICPVRPYKEAEWKRLILKARRQEHFR